MAVNFRETGFFTGEIADILKRSSDVNQISSRGASRRNRNVTISLHEASVGVFVPYLGNLSGLLDHASAHAEAETSIRPCF